MKNKQWIRSPISTDPAAVTFSKSVTVKAGLKQALLSTSAVGVYRAEINGKKVGCGVLAPGYTAYDKRVQYHTEDVTDMLCASNVLSVTVAPGWAVGHLGFKKGNHVYADHMRAAAELKLVYEDGKEEYVCADESWSVYTNEVTFADIYNGETIDKTHSPKLLGSAVLDNDGSFPLVPQIGDDIVENEILTPISLIVTPLGERVIDFGQNMTGYVTLRIKGKRGERVVLTHAEVLDKDGNFYTENYRSAENKLTFILSGGEDFFKPAFSFQGFRYVRVDEYPEGNIDLEGFRAVVVHTKLDRIGRFECGDTKINQLYHNIIWGQKSNYLDLPTDCPQRDERMGWTGDAQVFCRTAGMNFDVYRFFEKWLADMRAEQGADGSIRGVCPERFALEGYHTRIATGWGDAATIIPWTLYELYGKSEILAENFDMMCKWVNYMRGAGEDEYLWLGGYHYGDWLAMDAGEDSYVGATSNDLIASAFYANSVRLVIRAGEVLGYDVDEYRELYINVVRRFREYFMENGMPKDEFPYTEIPPSFSKSPVDTVRHGMTQTALVLILHFDLCLPEEREALSAKLEELIHDFGDRMSTGFLGTPYILHVLSACGKTELAYKLFFNTCNPSWLYAVEHGATTVWEHWNGIKEDGSFWSKSMNSFNHYAYGSVCDWIYKTVCGVDMLESAYKKIRLAPVPCERLGFAKCAIETPCGRLESHWYYAKDRICFEFTVPELSEAEIVLPDGRIETVRGGSYCYSVLR